MISCVSPSLCPQGCGGPLWPLPMMHWTPLYRSPLGPTPTWKWDLTEQWSLAMDIWLSSLETCSNLFTLGPPSHQCQHRIQRLGRGGGQETWNLCGRLWRPSFLWLISTGLGGGMAPSAPPWIRYWVLTSGGHWNTTVSASRQYASYWNAFMLDPISLLIFRLF